MQIYILKNHEKTQYKYMKIIREMKNGYIIQFSRKKNNWKDYKTDYIPKDLFNNCIQTGILKEIDN